MELWSLEQWKNLCKNKLFYWIANPTTQITSNSPKEEENILDKIGLKLGCWIYYCKYYTQDSEINVAHGMTVAPPLKNFHIMIVILFSINLGIEVIFYLFFLQNFSEINNLSPMGYFYSGVSSSLNIFLSSEFIPLKLSQEVCIGCSLLCLSVLT